ncbi:hypothetical protein BO83DRAFT_158154 [Aspergillus eucalypticola CBS 122712]|uniref:Uncharacterized protein n=1 Tax=Aspergillus eucalypticola (strain CBS 122712 / IBT 29274) TaxID=1448314 RepID=A0A317UNE3_ASPEC|nr:uncharacterized protein BO83DRAFT_158154 [Aspergillus eucalypticola CBS 122712]PWY63503.1 hypothetical protein BO83DRAFT_158154 [Aspergillus eucalypticola CBS 122712]
MMKWRERVVGWNKATGVCVCGKLAIIGKAIVPFLFLFISFFFLFFSPYRPINPSVRVFQKIDYHTFLNRVWLQPSHVAMQCHYPPSRSSSSSNRAEARSGQVSGPPATQKVTLSATPPIPKSPRMSPVPKWVTANPDRGRGGFRLPPMAVPADWSARMATLGQQWI